MSPITRHHRLLFAALVGLQIVIGSYGLDQPVRWGHQGFHVGEHGLGARNLGRHGAFTFSAYHGRGAPPPSALSFHHPTMLQVPVWLVQSVFGEAPWTARIVGLAFCLFALFSLWTFCCRARGPNHALLACAIFVLDPLNVAFCNLPDVQLVAIAALLQVGSAWVRVFEDPRPRRVAAVLAWTAVACFADWPTYPVTLAWLVLGSSLLFGNRARAIPKDKLRRLRTCFALVAVVAATVLAQHFARAWANGSLDDLFGAYAGRSIPTSLVDIGHRLVAHHTLVLMLLGLGWTLWAMTRGADEPVTQFVLAVMIGESLYLARFRNEFMFHEYRSYWYVFPFAFASADVVLSLARHWAARTPPGGVHPVGWGAAPRHPGVRRSTGLLCACLVAMLGLRAIPMMVRSRARSGSTSMERYDPQTELYSAARVIRSLSRPDSTVLLGPGLEERLDVFWLLDRPSWRISAVPQIRRPCFVLARAETLRSNGAWRATARQGAVLLLEPYAVLELPARGAPSVEAGVVRTPPLFGPVLRWLRAPLTGPTLVERAPPRTAAAFARQLGALDDVIRRADAGETPLQARLPRDLRSAAP